MSRCVTSSRFGAFDPLEPPALPGVFADIVWPPPVDIAAPIEVVWSILADLERYPIWCPFNRRVDGLLAVGNEIGIHVHWGPHAPLAEGRHLVQREVITIVEPPRALAWSASMLGLRAERLQYLEPIAGGVRYHTYDRFAGPMVPLVLALYRSKIHAGFAAVGQALKARAEMRARGAASG